MYKLRELDAHGTEDPVSSYQIEICGDKCIPTPAAEVHHGWRARGSNLLSLAKGR